jgi:hypothetical protein
MGDMIDKDVVLAIMNDHVQVGSMIKAITALPAAPMGVNGDEYEHVTYRVEWVFKIGTIGDSEGRSWAKDLIEKKVFATQKQAEAYRDAHPDLELSQWGNWKTKHSYGLVDIVRREAPVSTIPPQPAPTLADAVALIDAEATKIAVLAAGLEPRRQAALESGEGPTTFGEEIWAAGMRLRRLSAALQTKGDV